MLHLIGWIVFGLIVGIIAKLLVPGRPPDLLTVPTCPTRPTCPTSV